MLANKLKSQTQLKSSCCNEYVLTVDDVDIKPFNSICRLTGRKCTLQPVPLSTFYGGGPSDIWAKYEEPFGDINEYILVEGSYFTCAVGMTRVKIVDAGQDSVTVGNFPTTVNQNGYSDAIVEGFISSASQDQFIDVPALPTDISITGGFMESTGHGYKSSNTNYIDGAGQPGVQTPGNYNIGIDYVFVKNGVEDGSRGQDVESWFGGEIIKSGLEGGYGYRVHIQTGEQYEHNGVSYPIKTAYAHLQNNPYPSFNYDPNNPIRIRPGQAFAQMGGTGSGGAEVYPIHVDFEIYINTPNGKITLSPNLFLGELVAVEGAVIACPNAVPATPRTGPR